MRLSPTRLLLALGASALPAAAQGSPFRTPGMPPAGRSDAGAADSGQTDRFSSEFNPAFSFILDAVADWLDPADPTADDGLDADLRTLELSANAWIDPRAWAYFIGATEGEELAIEEAAVHFVGLPGNHVIRAGRFFIDFGKQMQTHVHELRTLERPLALRAYLGEEVKGDGAQWDCWTTVGDATVVRWSLGAFSSLLPEEDAFPALDQTGEEIRREVAERKDAGDLNFTARVTGFTDAGTNGTFQLGASLRSVPDFTFEDATNGLTAAGLSNEVWGVDLTYGWTGGTGERTWLVGGELLAMTGDSGAVVNDPNATPGDGDETLTVLDDGRLGWFAFVDHGLDRFNSVGLQYSAAELADAAGSDASELELHYTRLFSEFHRIRLAVATTDLDTGDEDWRVALQYTTIVGAHGHGVNF